MKNRLLTALFTLLLCFPLYAQTPRAAYGKFPTTNFSPSEYESREGQNHGIALGPDDKMYIANNGGILVYNGISLRMIEDPEERVILSLAFSPRGNLYFGSDNSIGYVDIDPFGNARLTEMLEVFGDKGSSFGRIKGIKFWDKKVWFYSDRTLFVLNQDHQLIKEYSIDNLVELLFVDGRPLLFEKFGAPKEIGDDGALNDLKSNQLTIDQIKFVKKIGDDRILVKGESKILIISVQGDRIVVEKKLNNDALLDYEVNDVLEWKDNSLLIGTETRGLLKLDDNGSLEEVANMKKGLQSNYVKKMNYDHQGNLWLALDFGVSVIDINAPVTYFGPEFGITSNVDDILETKSGFYLGTASGLLKWNENSQSFEQIQGFEEECWSIAEVVRDKGENSLLLLGANSVVEYKPNSGFETIARCIPFIARRSANDPSRYWIGTEKGFLTLKLKDGFLVEEHRNEALNLDIRKIITDGRGNIWMGSDEFGAIKISMDERTGIPDFENRHNYDSSKGISVGGPYPTLYKDAVLFGTTDGLFQYNEARDNFEPAEISIHENQINTNYFYRIKEGRDMLWAITFDFGINDFQNGFLQEGKGLIYRPFKETTEAIIHRIYPSPVNPDVWFGGELGIYGIINSGEDYLDYEIVCNLEEMRFGSDSIFFGGFGPANSGMVWIPYSTKPLSFHFSATSFKKRRGLQFKYRLVGFENSWSEWKEKNDVVYTNLSGGKYTLEVIARDFFGVESRPLQYKFRVMPPWFLTWWAYGMYGIFFIGFVYGAVTISNRGLRMIIKEKTKEITAQKDEIEIQNSELESQNEEILAQRDQLEEQNQVIGNKNRQITDSIHYAQRIQLAILPPPAKISSLLPNSSIMYRPKDIVSGDFYWMESGRGKNEGKTLFAAVDCTGHGVPGAFVSIIGYNGLNRVVRESEVNQTGQILDRLNQIVNKTLNPMAGDGTEVKDGMDISLCSFDPQSLEVEYSGAHNSLYIIRHGNDPLRVNSETLEPNLEGENDAFLYEIKADKMPIGAFEKEGQFSTKSFVAKKNDMLFLFTDGFADQFGGPKGKKYMYRSFKKFLLRQVDEPIAQINSNLEKEYEEWKGEQEQIDDVCIIAVRL